MHCKSCLPNIKPKIRLLTFAFCRYLSAGTSFIWSSASYFVSLVTFATYVLSDPVANVLDPERAFVSISLFNILRFPMSMLPMIISMMVQVRVTPTH